MQRPEVFVSETKVQVQPGGELPGILEEKVEGVDLDESLRIAHGNGRLSHVTGHEVS